MELPYSFPHSCRNYHFSHYGGNWYNGINGWAGYICYSSEGPIPYLAVLNVITTHQWLVHDKLHILCCTEQTYETICWWNTDIKDKNWSYSSGALQGWMVAYEYLWTGFGAVHDGVAAIHGPLIYHLSQTLLTEVISRVHDPSTQWM